MSFFKDSNENSDWWHEQDYKKRSKSEPKKETVSYDELYDLAYAAHAGKTTKEDNERLIKMFNQYFKD